MKVTEVAQTEPTKVGKPETDKQECEECGSSNIQTHTDEIICHDCGLVLAEHNIDHGPEWRAFDSQQMEKKSRVGAPMTVTMHDRGLSTVMGNINTAGMSTQKREQLKRMKEWETRSLEGSGKQRGLKFSLGEIQRLISALDLSRSIHEMSASLFRKIHKENLLQGRSYEGMSSAAVYIICRKQNIPRTLQEVSDVSRVDEQKIRRSMSKIREEMDITWPLVDPMDFVARYVSDIIKSTDTKLEHQRYKNLERSTRYIINNTEEVGVGSGKSPAVVVGGAIYLSSKKMGINFTQDEVGDVVGVSPLSVRSMQKKQTESLG